MLDRLGLGVGRRSAADQCGASVAVVVGVRGTGQQDKTGDDLLPVGASALQSGALNGGLPAVGS